MSGASGLRLREAGPGDLAVVLHHRECMFRDMGYDDEAALRAVRAASEPFFQRALEQGRYRGFLLEEPGGAVVAGGGIVLLDHHPGPRDPQPRRPVVVNVYTERSHRRRGLARRLMQAMVAWASAAGYRELYLHASDDGRALYESLGFEPTNEMRLRLG